MCGSSFTLLVLIAIFLKTSSSLGSEQYEESLWIRRLPSGHIHTRMEFVIKNKKSKNISHTTLFPRTLSEILVGHNVEELQFSLTQGHWRLESWGDPYPSYAAPTGAHLVAWFSSNSSDSIVDANWRGLTNRLSGLTCASLNFLDESTSIEPKFAYRPEGKISNLVSPKSPKKHLHVRVGSLPREFICTENLSPWTKLLPCGIMRGVASLLRSKQVFNTHYHSAGLRYIQSEVDVSLKFTLSMVFGPPSSGQGDNFAKSVIGSLAIFPCHPSTKTSVKIWNNKAWKDVRHEDLNALKLKDVPEVAVDDKTLIFTPMKYMGGYGQEYGKMVIEMTNHLTDRFLPVLYVEVLPWYIRPYLHTMKIEVTHGHQKLPVPPGDYFHYSPGRDRKALHKLEMDVQIPPSSKITLSFMVEKGHLKWDEYPPDANHGFYLEAAHFEVNLTTNGNNIETRHYYSRILLINLSTPDFSMPYNVICLTCTVVALAFGPIHNITTKRLQLKVIPARSEKLKKLWNRLRGKKVEDDAQSLAKSESDTAAANNTEEYGEISSESQDISEVKQSS